MGLATMQVSNTSYAGLLQQEPVHQGLQEGYVHIKQLVNPVLAIWQLHYLLQGRLTVQEAIDAARLEEAYQIEEWGLVEGGHDIDIADICVRISAPVMFHRLLKQGS